MRHLTEANHEELLATDGLKLIFAYKDNCPLCELQLPMLKSFATTIAIEDAEFYFVDSVKEPELAQQVLDVTVTPSLVYYKDGEVVMIDYRHIALTVTKDIVRRFNGKPVKDHLSVFSVECFYKGDMLEHKEDGTILVTPKHVLDKRKADKQA